MRKIYLDYAATTPADPEVVKAMQPFFFEKFGNASSPHGTGREAKKAVENARAALAQLIGAKPEEIIFTSGGTESNNHVLFGVADALKAKGNHIIISKVEHHSILEAAHHLEKRGCTITYLPVDKNGCVDPHEASRSISDKTILISVMHANNEIGTIEPINEIAELAKQKGVYVHTDAAQTVGHIPVNIDQLKVDFLTVVGHKFCAPKGVGALYIRKGSKISPLLVGGGQERGRRSSTLNLTGIVGLGKAAELCRGQMAEEIKTQTVLRNQIISAVSKRITDSFLNGHPDKRLPNNVNFSFAGIEGESLLMSLDMAGIAVSMGSACTSGALEPSYVLRAIGRSDELALGSIRITLGRWTTQEDVDYFLNQLVPIVERLRTLNSAHK